MGVINHLFHDKEMHVDVTKVCTSVRQKSSQHNLALIDAKYQKGNLWFVICSDKLKADLKLAKQALE